MSEIEIQTKIQTLPRINLAGRQLYDLELLLVGGFEPLAGFMNESAYDSVCESMRLPTGEVFPIPIVLDVPHTFFHDIGEEVLLCDQFGNPLAIMTIESRFTPDKKREAELVYGTQDHTHPGVRYLFYEMHPEYIGGRIDHVALPKRYDFTQFRKTPEELRNIFKDRGWDTVIGFQTRNPMHRAHFELVRRAHEKLRAPVLVHPVVGMTKPGDVDYVTRVRTYNVVCNTHGKDFTYLSLLPLAMRMAGPREAVWHALIRKNYGCTHFIVGRDHAGPGNGKDGQPFYDSSAARSLVEKYADDIGITILPSEELVYVPHRKKYLVANEIEKDEETENISGTEFRRRLNEGEEIPEWFSFPESISILRESVKRDTRPGIAFFFTGLPGAGKSTIAELLLARLQEIQDRDVTFLDGDVIREHLSKGLTFSKEDRDENVRRVGFVASEVVKHGGITICALVSPYKEARRHARSMVENSGTFIEIYVATLLETCEERDTKGHYKKARKGEIKNFTGVDDPYEVPENPEITLHTEQCNPDEHVDEIVEYLRELGVIV